MTAAFSTGKLDRSPLRRKEVGTLLDLVLENDPDQPTTLTEIMHLVGMQSGVTSDGWSRETARMFAIDTATIAVRRNMTSMSDADRQSVITLVQQARTLVSAGRDDELDFVQAALEVHLGRTGPGRERQVWLTAIDSLLPSPYRAALVTTKAALALGSSEAPIDLADLLRDRLLARLMVGSLHVEPTNPLHLTG